MYLNEEIARTTLGTNYERIIASIENYNDTIAMLRPSKIIDLEAVVASPVSMLRKHGAIPNL